eukprot:TRINITY_DN17601_c0_g1_i1.p1 TRINITY_DN17601_c0_g1~~TRINITY_DN17601_c0_g1_i1.p1  ORF type:complete len:777 (+),score=169.39 TRINITY_DN17601_c0_g1_i1:717-3047(+)
MAMHICITLLVFLCGGIAQEYRTYDGTNNNVANPTWGSAGSRLLRYNGNNFYADGISTIRSDLPNPRVISNIVFGNKGDQPDSARGLSDLTTYWGQFIDHDMSHTPHQKATEYYPIAVPKCDPDMDSNCTGQVYVPFTRSVWDPSSGTGNSNPREQINDITSFIDGSQVYGSDSYRASTLRIGSGGRMWTVFSGQLPPFNTNNLTMDNDVGYVPDTSLFAFGDVRGNENVGLLSLQALFLREHNRWCNLVSAANPNYADEEIFQEARRRVIAVIQAITVNEYIPVTLGKPLPAYTGYDPTVNPSIMTEFSTGAFRYGHSEVNSDFLRLGTDFTPSGSPLRVLMTYYNPSVIQSTTIDDLIRGMSFQTQKKVDAHVVEDLRNYLFSYGGKVGMDLVAINTMRGRDHGIPSFQEARAMFGLSPYTSFDDVTANATLAAALSQAYAGNLEDCDLYVCGLAEDNAVNANVGPTFAAIITEQYRRVRDGDRFWYENGQFNGTEAQDIASSTLGAVIMRNTNTAYIQCSVFSVPDGNCWLGQPPPSGTTPGAQPPADTFVITVALKTEDHPFYGQGSNTAFVVNGIAAANLTLVRGQTYKFINKASAEHQLFLSRTASGYANGMSTCYNAGYTTNCPADYQVTMYFTPPLNDSMYQGGGLLTPQRLSYSCTQHVGMGGPIYLVNGLSNGTTSVITASTSGIPTTMSSASGSTSTSIDSTASSTSDSSSSSQSPSSCNSVPSTTTRTGGDGGGIVNATRTIEAISSSTTLQALSFLGLLSLLL